MEMDGGNMHGIAQAAAPSLIKREIKQEDIEVSNTDHHPAVSAIKQETKQEDVEMSNDDGPVESAIKHKIKQEDSEMSIDDHGASTEETMHEPKLEHSGDDTDDGDDEDENHDAVDEDYDFEVAGVDENDNDDDNDVKYSEEKLAAYEHEQREFQCDEELDEFEDRRIKRFAKRTQDDGVNTTEAQADPSVLDTHPEWHEAHLPLPPVTDMAELTRRLVDLVERNGDEGEEAVDFAIAVKVVLHDYDPEALKMFCNLKGVRRFEFLRTEQSVKASVKSGFTIMRFKKFVVVTNYDFVNETECGCYFDTFLRFEIDDTGVWKLKKCIIAGKTLYGRWGWTIKGVHAIGRTSLSEARETRSVTSGFASYMLRDELWKPTRGIDMEYSYSSRGMFWTGGARDGEMFLRYYTCSKAKALSASVRCTFKDPLGCGSQDEEKSWIEGTSAWKNENRCRSVYNCMSPTLLCEHESCAVYGKKVRHASQIRRKCFPALE